MAQFNWDASNYEVQNYKPLPEAWYPAQIIESSMERSQAGHNYLKFTFQILYGEGQGRQVFANLNVEHPNPEVQEYAFNDLYQIGHATGVLTGKDTSLFHKIPMEIKLKIEQQDGYEPQNVIKRYRKLENANVAQQTPSFAQQAQTTQQPPAQPAGMTGQPQQAPSWAQQPTQQPIEGGVLPANQPQQAQPQAQAPWAK